MEEEKKEITNLLKSAEFKQFVQHTIQFRLAKNAGSSEIIRQQGNDMLKNCSHDAQIHEEIWKTYSLSIAVAESGTEVLALAYSNRSFILMHMGKYAECIKDIDRALDITRNKVLSIKLLLRKVKCLHALGLAECKSVCQEAEHLWNEITEASLKKSFQNDIDKMKLLLSKPLKPKSIPKNRKSEMLAELVHQYRINDFSSVKVHYSNRYGRHLIAAKDFRPGDVIYIEKPIVQVANIPRSHAYCSHCFATTWANIPCDHCAWVMFCSEECKKEAWMKYHDIECSLYGNSKENENDKHKQVAIRMLIMAIREFGSVEELKSELKVFDKCSDRKKGFVVDEKVETNGFKTIYALSRHVSNESLKKHKLYTQMVLKGLAKDTSFYGDYFISNDVNSYKKNENAVFLGSLFLRLSKISQINSRQMWNHTYDCRKNWSNVLCWENQCCSAGVYIAPVSSLLNHSCTPNVSRCYTSDHTIVLYAVQPIKKASQLFDCYTGPYYVDHLVGRQLILSHVYNFHCDCIACKQQWPVQQFDVRNNYNDKTIAQLRDGIEKGLKKSSTARPSIITSNLIDGLQVIFNQIYGINLEVPKICYNI